MNIAQLKQHSMDPLYRNSIFLIANTAVNSGFGFFFWMVIARFYTDAEVGLGVAIISAATYLALISTLGLNITLIRFLPKSKEPGGLINSCLTLSGIAAIAASGIFIAGLDLWSPETAFIQDNSLFIIAFIAFSVCWSLFTIMDAVFVAIRRAEFTLAQNTIYSLLKIPLPILMALFFHAFGIFSSWGIAVGIAFLISVILFLPRLQKAYKPIPSFNLRIIKDIWRYSAGNYFAILFMAAPALILPLMIVNLIGAEQNAYFYVAWMISILLMSIPTAVSQSLFAEVSHHEEELAVKARRSLKLILILLVPAIIFVVVSGKWLLLLFGEGYSSNALNLLRIISLSCLFSGINSIYYSILRVQNRVVELMVLQGLVALAMLVISGVVMPSLGIIGTGYTVIGIRLLNSIYVLLMVKSRYRVNLFRFPETLKKLSPKSGKPDQPKT